jgi:hypothetical protein
MDDSKDGHERRCPRLGHSVSFHYCRECGDGGEPCWKIVDCWWEYFDIMEYLKNNLPEETVEKLMTVRPKAKTTHLVELIQQAQQRLNKA